MKKELLLYKKISNNLPRIPKITGVANRLFKTLYFRNNTRKHEKYVVNVFDKKLELEPFECVDGGLFFYPHIYDKEEFDFLKKYLSRNDIFFDLGANIGIYSIVASEIIGNNGRAIGIEADPYNFKKFKKNIQLNRIKNITALNIGLSDKNEVLRLGLNTTGNRGGNSFAVQSDQFVEVECRSLSSIVKELNINFISMLKIDIEGFEYRVLKEFFDNNSEQFFPKHIIIEHLHASEIENPILLLNRIGYREIKKNKYNSFLEYKK